MLLGLSFRESFLFVVEKHFYLLFGIPFGCMDFYSLSGATRYDFKSGDVRKSRYTSFCAIISPYVLLLTSVSSFSNHICALILSLLRGYLSTR